MKHCIRFIILILLIAVGMPATLFAEEGVTDTEIHIGTFGPLSGPAKLWGDTLYGSDLLFKMVNAEGGIHGRKVVFHMIDDSYNPAKAKAGVKRLHESVGIFAWVGSPGTASSMAVKDYLVKRNVPWVGPVVRKHHGFIDKFFSVLTKSTQSDTGNGKLLKNLDAGFITGNSALSRLFSTLRTGLWIPDCLKPSLITLWNHSPNNKANK